MVKKILSAPMFILGIILIIAQFIIKYFINLIFLDLYYSTDASSFMSLFQFFDYYTLLWIGLIFIVLSIIGTVSKNKKSKVDNLEVKKEEKQNIDLDNKSGEVDINKLREERNAEKETLKHSVDLSGESGEVDLNKLKEAKVNDVEKNNKENENKVKKGKNKLIVVIIGIVLVFSACGLIMNNYYTHSISYYQKHGVPIEDGKIQIDKDDFINIVNYNLISLDNKWGDYDLPELTAFETEDASVAGEGYHYYYTTVKMDKEPDINIVFLLDEENKIEYINIGYNWIEVKPKDENDIANQLYYRDNVMAGYCNVIYGSLSGFYNHDVDYYDNIMAELYDLDYDNNFVAENEYKGDSAIIKWSYTEQRQSMIEIDKLTEFMY